MRLRRLTILALSPGVSPNPSAAWIDAQPTTGWITAPERGLALLHNANTARRAVALAGAMELATHRR